MAVTLSTKEQKKFYEELLVEADKVVLYKEIGLRKLDIADKVANEEKAEKEKGIEEIEGSKDYHKKAKREEMKQLQGQVMMLDDLIATNAKNRKKALHAISETDEEKNIVQAKLDELKK